MTMYDELVVLAKGSIEHGRIHGAPLFRNPRFMPAELRVPGETFVSLRSDSKNRGCMGNALAPKPIFESVLSNAFRAAFKDPRFNPIRGPVLEQCTLELYHMLPDDRTVVYVNDIDRFAEMIQPDHTLTVQYLGRNATMLMTMQSQYKTRRDFAVATREKLEVIPASVSWADLVCTLSHTVKTEPIKYSEIPECPVTV